MARSLARQEGFKLPIHLTVFHNRPEDARFVAEGAADGPSSPSLTFIEVPDERIMQRALHFSEAHRMHGLSHTVFFDVDLWFPPGFWAAYASVLATESPGYWSCRVMNIPYPESEAFVNQWTEITQERLEGVAAGRRLDQYGGKVGHFQCIPRNLAVYPADPLQAVHSVDLAFSATAIERSIERRSERRISRTPAYHFDHPQSWEGTRGIQL